MSLDATTIRRRSRDLAERTVGLNFITLERRVPNVDPKGEGPAPAISDTRTVACVFSAVRTTERGQHRAVTIFDGLDELPPDGNYWATETDAAGTPVPGAIPGRLVDSDGAAASLPTSTGTAWILLHVQQGAP